jgi:hypothetical protein
VKFDCIPLLCDNESAVKIATNPVQHKRTKHIDICHHFLRDHVSKDDIVMEGVRTDDQLMDIFTKPLDETHFCKLRSELTSSTSQMLLEIISLLLFIYITLIIVSCHHHIHMRFFAFEKDPHIYGEHYTVMCFTTLYM